MDIKSEEFEYEGPGGTFRGLLVWDAKRTGPLPGVLVTPAFSGRSQFEETRAKELAELGYAALAMDYYGEGKRAADPAEASNWMAALNSDRPLLAARMQAALAAFRAAPQVDAKRVAAIGYCFGGKAVLDLVRDGSDIAGVVALHGVLDRAKDAAKKPISAKILCCHGWDDPLATPQAVEALATELTELGADWQIHAYGHTGHAFTNPGASGANGMAFSETANARSWYALRGFLEEVLI